MRAEEKNAHLEQLEEGLTSLALRGAALPLGSGEGGATTSQPAAAAETMHEDNNRWLCVVCLEAEKSVVLLPCAHMCMCGDCTESLMANTRQCLCPVCRGPVATTQRIFT